MTMTKEEIIQALECCADIYYCTDCSCKEFCNDLGKLQKNALDLINHQQAEIEGQAQSIERLQIENGFIRNKALVEGKATATAIMAEYEQHRRTSEYIGRLNAEIERLQNDLAISKKETKRYATRRASECEDCAGCTQWNCDCANERSYAIEMFLEKCKSHAYYIDFPKEHRVIDEDDICNIAKEMVGDDR